MPSAMKLATLQATDLSTGDTTSFSNDSISLKRLLIRDTTKPPTWSRNADGMSRSKGNSGRNDNSMNSVRPMSHAAKSSANWERSMLGMWKSNGPGKILCHSTGGSGHDKLILDEKICFAECRFFRLNKLRSSYPTEIGLYECFVFSVEQYNFWFEF